MLYKILDISFHEQNLMRKWITRSPEAYRSTRVVTSSNEKARFEEVYVVTRV